MAFPVLVWQTLKSDAVRDFLATNSTAPFLKRLFYIADIPADGS